jgi:hypothetical protein
VYIELNSSIHPNAFLIIPTNMKGERYCSAMIVRYANNADKKPSMDDVTVVDARDQKQQNPQDPPQQWANKTVYIGLNIDDGRKLYSVHADFKDDKHRVVGNNHLFGATDICFGDMNVQNGKCKWPQAVKKVEADGPQIQISDAILMKYSSSPVHFEFKIRTKGDSNDICMQQCNPGRMLLSYQADIDSKITARQYIHGDSFTLDGAYCNTPFEGNVQIVEPLASQLLTLDRPELSELQAVYTGANDNQAMDPRMLEHLHHYG